MVRTVGGECTGSCRLGHVFLTSPFVLPLPPSSSLFLPPSWSIPSSLHHLILFLRSTLFISGEKSDEEVEIGQQASERKSGTRRGTSSERGVVGERGGTRGNEVLYLWLFLHRLFHLSFPPARDTGRAEHYNSSSPFLSLIPLARSCCNVSFPPLRLLFFFCTPAT